MKTYEEMAQDALNRIGKYEAEQKKRRKKFAEIAAPVAGCCLIAVVCISALQSKFFKTDTPPVNADNTASVGSNYSSAHDNFDKASEQDSITDKNNTDTADPNTVVNEKTDAQVITGNGPKGADVVTDNGFCLFWWHNKLSMGGSLYFAIEDNPNGKFAVLAAYRPTTANVTSFTYEGKTLAEWAIEADNERIMPEKMTQLLKEGDELKYGKSLYEVGTPSGEKWAKSFYEERIAFYGKELLEKYIVNGVFLRDALQKDLAAYNEQAARKGYKLAYNAYLETVLPEAASQLSKNGIKCERADYMNNGLIFTATADELENLPLEDLKDWTFYLASEHLKGTSDYETYDSGLQVVN